MRYNVMVFKMIIYKIFKYLLYIIDGMHGFLLASYFKKEYITVDQLL